MARRAHAEELRTGRIELDRDGSRHLRDVLRLAEGDEVEIFDDAGNVGVGRIVRCDSDQVVVEVKNISKPTDKNGIELTIASAVPKGERADWMIEKLSELGCSRFVPLETSRSIVLPAGRNKHTRWERIAIESAKQSRRVGVMKINELTKLEALLGQDAQATIFCLSTAADAAPIFEALFASPRKLALLIGPEGGWTDDEMRAFKKRGIVGLKLTDTTLRVETAAVAAAAIVAALAASNPDRKT